MKTVKTEEILTILFLILTTLSASREVQGCQDLFSNSVDIPAEEPGLFEGNDCLEIMIITDLDTLLKDIGDNPSYHNAKVRYKNNDGLWEEVVAEIRVRGNFRKQSVNCDFPPLRLKFEKKDRENTIFDKTKNIKIVTHCQTNIPEYEQYLLQEYLIYRLYNILSDYSYKVRLMKVIYLDDIDSTYRVEKYAFLLEDEEELEERFNGQLLNLETVDPDNVDVDYYLLVAFFEYLIINTDWSLPILHNVDLLSVDYFKPPVPVPFDFDWSGLINIPYKIPTVNGLKTRVPERVYKGPCVKARDLKRITKLFQSKKEEIFNLYYDFPHLDNDYKAETFENIQIFYEILENRYIFHTVFIKQCTY